MQLQYYPAVTPFEHSLLSKTWEGVRHPLVVRAGDGRFVKAFKTVLPKDARIVSLESREELFEGSGFSVLGGEWDLEALRKEVSEYGRFDTVILLHFHEYWEGKVGSLTRLMEFLDPNGICWMQFLNGSCLSIIDARLRAGGLRGQSLSNPYHKSPPLDLQGVAHWGNSFGLVCDEVWGYAEDSLYQWATGKRKKELKLELLKRNFPVKTVMEGVAAGAHVLGLRFRHRKADEERQTIPRVGVARMSPPGFQMFLIPHPYLDDREADLWQDLVQAKARAHGRISEVSPMRTRLIREFDDDKSVKRVLLVGAAHAGDFISMSESFDKWEWEGVDHDADRTALWKERFPDQTENLVSWDPESPFPFENDTFDLVLSLNAFSRCNPALALRYAGEMIRVSRNHIVHLENTTGPVHDAFSRTVPLPPVYERVGWRCQTRPVLMEGKDTGWATVFIEKNRDRMQGEGSSVSSAE